MTKRQLMALLYESYRVEAEEQLRLILASFHGHPEVKRKEYMKQLEMQANPIDKEADAKIDPREAIEELQKLFGKDLKSN